MAYTKIRAYDADCFYPEFRGLSQYGDNIGTDPRYSPDAVNVDTRAGVMMDEYKRSGKNMTRALNDVLDSIENLGAPNQETLPGFEIPAPDKQALVEASLERTRERIAAERAGAVEGQIGLPGMDAQAFTETSEDSNTAEPGPEEMRTPETQEAIDERRARGSASG